MKAEDDCKLKTWWWIYNGTQYVYSTVFGVISPESCYAVSQQQQTNFETILHHQ